MSIKIISWNVNGLRSVIKKNVFYEFINQENPDIFCLQEIKSDPKQIDLKLENYHQYWNAAKRKGYAGTLVLSKVEAINCELNFHDNFEIVEDLQDKFGDLLTEGRVITLEYDNFWVVNVYTPNAKRDLERLDLRYSLWDPLFLRYLKFLEEKKPVVVCGDFNVAHKEIDLARPKSNKKNAGFTDEERAGFDRYIQNGFVDTFRMFNKEGGNYTWWSHFAKSRERNVGWRIDYVLVSDSLTPRVKNAFILPNIMGSDHCPVGIILD
jgi:exodeoxyribonuclease-3